MNKERLIIAILLVFLSVAITPFLIAENVTTSINISNSGPYLVSNIPNQAWQSNTDLIEIFDLDDFFADNNGDSLDYSASSPQNISVVIDSGGKVSFYPDLEYRDVSYIVFYASDGSFNVSSNNVTLNVGVDTIPPQWSSPSKSASVVYQNSYVNFTSSWTDDFQLKRFLFSISQGGGWSNSSYIDFKGTQNTSLYTAQISAAAGNNASWFFCADDTSGNSNCTIIQTFVVSSQSFSSGQTSDQETSSYREDEGVIGIFKEAFVKKNLNFTLEPNLFKISIKQGFIETRILRVSNIGNTNLSFKVEVENVEDFVALSEDSFELFFGETKDIAVDFKANENVAIGQYFGRIVVSSSKERKDVPIVIDVNALEFGFEVDVSVPEQSKRVRPGNEAEAKIEIKNLRDSIQDEATLYIAIKDFSGIIYDSFQEQIKIEGSSIFEKKLRVPNEAKLGPYIFYARISVDDFNAIGSDSFDVGSRFNFQALFKFGSVIFLIIFLSALATILFLRYRKERDKERLLNLYLMLNELKNLIKEGKSEKAIELYIRIKVLYGEPVSKTILENKEKLREEINKLSLRLKKEVGEAGEEIKNEIKKASEEKEEKEDDSSEKLFSPVREEIKDEKTKKSEKKTKISRKIQKEESLDKKSEKAAGGDNAE